jgi:plastocyanin
MMRWAIAAVAAAAASYLPNAQDAKIVTVSTMSSGEQAAARLIVQTQGVAIKETGPKATVAQFGEVYAFAPSTLLVHRDEPTLIEFWNLQPDDDHDFMLMDSRWAVMMKITLPSLQKTAYVFTFHEEGLFNFTCTVHQPAMNGQILVLPPTRAISR